MGARGVVLVMLAHGVLLAQGWVGQHRVSRFDDDTDGQPSIACDSGGSPWVVWHGYSADTSRMYSRCLGGRWDEERGVGADPPGVITTFKPWIASDHRGRAWVVWDNVKVGNTDGIGSSYWADTCWSPEIQVNQPDSTELDFAPKVACGGGQVWCVWYGGPTDVSPYSVYASRWNGLVEQWSEEMRVSPADGRHHWWCDVAVDENGRPHVVWCTHPLYTVFHSYYDGDSWSTPKPVNGPTQFTASPWAAPRIVIDREGVLHVSFTGARVGALYRDILYTRNDGSGWQPCQMVTRDSVYHEWYADIAADRPDNVWVVYDRQGEGPDQFRVYASRYDGDMWSPEERLDDTNSYDDGGGSVCLDSHGFPWVIWDGRDYGSRALHVFYNRYGWVGISEEGRRPQSAGRPGALTWRPLATGVEFRYGLATPTCVELTLFDGAGTLIRTLVAGHEQSGCHSVRWDGRGTDGKPVASGTYFCRLATEDFSDVCKVALVTKARHRR